jgi:hypothetical protein
VPAKHYRPHNVRAEQCSRRSGNASCSPRPRTSLYSRPGGFCGLGLHMSSPRLPPTGGAELPPSPLRHRPRSNSSSSSSNRHQGVSRPSRRQFCCHHGSHHNHTQDHHPCPRRWFMCCRAVHYHRILAVLARAGGSLGKSSCLCRPSECSGWRQGLLCSLFVEYCHFLLLLFLASVLKWTVTATK